MEWRKYLNRKKPDSENVSKRKSDEGGGDDSKTVKRSKLSKEIEENVSRSVSQFQPLILDQFIDESPSASLVKGQYLIQASNIHLMQASNIHLMQEASRRIEEEIKIKGEMSECQSLTDQKSGKSDLEDKTIRETSDSSNVLTQIATKSFEEKSDSELFSDENAPLSDHSNDDDEPSVVPRSNLLERIDPSDDEHSDDDEAENNGQQKQVRKSESPRFKNGKNIDHSFV